MDRTQKIADRKSTRLNSSHLGISYAVFCLKKKKRLSTSPPGVPQRSAPKERSCSKAPASRDAGGRNKAGGRSRKPQSFFKQSGNHGVILFFPPRHSPV